jgi:hypothetical protein
MIKTWNKDLSTNTLTRLKERISDWQKKNIVSLSIAFYNIRGSYWALIYSNSGMIELSKEKQEIIRIKIESLNLDSHKKTTLRVIGLFLEVDENDWQLEGEYKRRCLIKINSRIPNLTSQTTVGITPKMIRVMMRMPLLEIGGLGGDKRSGFYRIMTVEDMNTEEIVETTTIQPVKEIFQEEWEQSLNMLLSINFIQHNEYSLSLDHKYVFLKKHCGRAYGDVLIGRKDFRNFGLRKCMNICRLDFSEMLEVI